MKKAALLSIAISFFLFACTNQDKENAKKTATDNLQTEFEHEFDRSVQGKSDFKKSYVAVMMDRAEIDVLSISDNSPKNAVVQIKKVPTEVRTALLGVIQRIDSWKAEKFNAADAINLIDQQLKVNPEKREAETLHIEIGK